MYLSSEFYQQSTHLRVPRRRASGERIRYHNTIFLKGSDSWTLAQASSSSVAWFYADIANRIILKQQTNTSKNILATRPRGVKYPLWTEYIKIPRSFNDIISTYQYYSIQHAQASSSSVVWFYADMANRMIPVLFYANKMDLPQAVSTAELTEVLELERILGNRPFHIACVDRLCVSGLALRAWFVLLVFTPSIQYPLWFKTKL